MALMHGPAFDESGRIVEREVPQVDIAAFKKAGYELGPLPEHLKPEQIIEVPAEDPKPKKKGK